MKRRIHSYSMIALCLMAVLALTLVSLHGNGAQAANGQGVIGLTKDNPGIRTAMEVQGRHTERLMGIPGVVGHGVGISSDGKPVIKIFVTRAGIPEIPAALEGVPTQVEITGMVVAYADPTARFPRPVPIGVSTGHPEITAGTIGCRVTDGTYVYALSNNHIYANENDAIVGDRALQPGPYDGGQDIEDDKIGNLHDYEPIIFNDTENTNTIDAAIAISSGDYLDTSTPDDGYGTPSSAIFGDADGDGSFDNIEGLLNIEVQKYGRTTGLTSGHVDLINVTVDVCYQTRGPFRCVKSALFKDQIRIYPGTFSAGGDSGSLVVTYDQNKNPVGLVFAGSSTHTFANRIDLVLDRFNVSVDSGGPIEPLTDIAVTEVNAPGSVVQGEEVDVYVKVQNTGNQDVVDSFDVDLTDLTESSLIGAQTVSSLAAGSSTTLTFLWDTSTADPGDHTLEGRHGLTIDQNSTNDTATTVVSIENALTDIAVAEVNAPGSVVQGEEVDVYVKVQNTGNQDVGSFDVDLTDLTESSLIGAQTVPSLAAGSSTTLTFPWDTSTASLTDHQLEGSHNFTDDDASNDSITAVVTVREASAIELAATGYKVKGRHHADLNWSGATSNVDIYRDGTLVAENTENDGFYTDSTNNVGGGSYDYKVCETGTEVCSNEATVTF